MVAEQSLNASDRFSLVPGVVLQESVEICCLHCAKRFFGPYEVLCHLQGYAFSFNLILSFRSFMSLMGASAESILYFHPHAFMTSCCTWTRYTLSNARTSLKFPSLSVYGRLADIIPKTRLDSQG